MHERSEKNQDAQGRHRAFGRVGQVYGLPRGYHAGDAALQNQSQRGSAAPPLPNHLRPIISLNQFNTSAAWNIMHARDTDWSRCHPERGRGVRQSDRSRGRREGALGSGGSDRFVILIKMHQTLLLAAHHRRVHVAGRA